MEKDKIAKLVYYIDSLHSEYVVKQIKSATGRVVMGSEIDIEKIIEHGVYPPDDPATPARLALLAIGKTIGLIGGEDLMHQIHDAYEVEYGAKKASSLSARWDSAAGLWYH